MDFWIDLHTHSTASDGTMTPSEVVAAAKRAGLCAIALTDHDTTAGLKEANRAAIYEGIELINGVEINADYPGEMHILGFYIDPDNPDLCRALASMKDFRAMRNQKMIQNLAHMGFTITEKETCALKEGGNLSNIGRVHMARVLVEKGYAKDIPEVFARYLGTGCPAYYAKQRFSPAECIRLIHKASGLAFLAHPIFILPNEADLKRELTNLRAEGLDGVECQYSSHTPEYQALCEKTCDALSLLKSGGSDFHAKNKPHIAIGRTYGNARISYNFLQNIKEFYRNLL